MGFGSRLWLRNANRTFSLPANTPAAPAAQLTPGPRVACPRQGAALARLQEAWLRLESGAVRQWEEGGGREQLAANYATSFNSQNVRAHLLVLLIHATDHNADRSADHTRNIDHSNHNADRCVELHVM